MQDATPQPARGSGTVDIDATCRCCGAHSVALLGSKPGRLSPQSFSYYRCEACGFVFVDPVTGEEIYNDAYYSGHGADPFVNYAAEYADYKATDRVLEFNNLFQIAQQYYAHPPAKIAPSKIEWLDLGCGAGGLLKYLRNQGQIRRGDAPLSLHPSGSDVGSYAERLKTADKFSIFSVDELNQLPPEQFDVISAIEVLEHIPSPLPVLTLVERLLKPGGLFIVTTGNIDCSAARRDIIGYRYCIPEIHISLFSPPTLTWLYKQVGLEPIQVHYDGVVRFKLLKSITNPFLRKIARGLLGVPGVVKAIDQAYGVSAMPCAVKPLK